MVRKRGLQRVQLGAAGEPFDGVDAPAAALEAEPDPSRERIREAISGNLCRCTGYQQIVDAIERAAAEMRGTRA